ncbi:MAG TPA: hypothetical protein VLJ83_09480 [Gemmatimonadaceae bacterium]|nr:hypothetical protein [Gemmatimonadaceae bacterium]
MRTSFRFLAVGLLLWAPGLRAQKRAADSTRAAAFDRLDRTSRTLIATVDCARASARARAEGQFGPIDSVGRWGECLHKDGRAFGLFFTPDSTMTRAQNLRVFDFANHILYSGSVDTSAVLAEARAARESVRKGMPSFAAAKRQFAPISMRSDGDSIEVWLLPAGLFMGAPTVGGERGFVYSPDGRTVVREIDASSQFRPLSIPDSGQVVIQSNEDDLPLISELIATNLLYDRGRDVRLATRAFTSVLAGPRSSPVWVQLKKR